MGKPRIIAETGAGQHGVATATICARYGLECVVYMGAEDVKRQSPNVYRMKLLGATVVPVESGSKTLKDALNEAMRDWVANVDNTFYIIGTVAGPAPYPAMVRDFQRVIGEECLTQMPELLRSLQLAGRTARCRGRLRGRRQQRHGHLPPLHPLGEHPPDRRRSGGRRAGYRQATPPRCKKARAGVLHGNRTFILQDHRRPDHRNAQHQRRPGLPGVGPEHAWLQELGRAQYVGITDSEALDAFHRLCRTEGIIPALESSHAVAYAIEAGPRPCAPINPSWSTSRAGATKTLAPWPTCRAKIFTTAPPCGTEGQRKRQTDEQPPHHCNISTNCAAKAARR